jgi:hypothetical protein
VQASPVAYSSQIAVHTLPPPRHPGGAQQPACFHRAGPFQHQAGVLAKGLGRHAIVAPAARSCATHTATDARPTIMKMIFRPGTSLTQAVQTLYVVRSRHSAVALLQVPLSACVYPVRHLFRLCPLRLTPHAAQTRDCSKTRTSFRAFAWTSCVPLHPCAGPSSAAPGVDMNNLFQDVR